MDGNGNGKGNGNAGSNANAGGSSKGTASANAGGNGKGTSSPVAATARQCQRRWQRQGRRNGRRDQSRDSSKSDPLQASTRQQRDGKEDLFRSDPQYEADYDAQGQVDVYGAKRAVEPPRPPLELGRQQYTSGAYDESSALLGELNPLLPGLAIYGDWRTAVAYNNNNGKDIAQIATRLNIDVDFKITGTERIHAFFTPFQEDNVKFTRYEFGGDDADASSPMSSTTTRRRCFSRVTSAPSIPVSPVKKPVSTCPSLSVSSRCSCRTGSGRTTRSSAAR